MKSINLGFLTRIALQYGMICLAAAMFTSGSAFASSSQNVSRTAVKIVHSDESGVTLEIQAGGYTLSPSSRLAGSDELVLPGFSTRSRPGEPAVPSYRILIALPPSGGYLLQSSVIHVSDAGSRLLEPVPTPFIEEDGFGGRFMGGRFLIEDKIYNQYKSRPLIEADSIAYIRHQRVLPVWINPVSYDPVERRLTIATRVRITVNFTGGDRLYPGGAENGELVREQASWNRILSKVVVNAETARKWMIKPGFRPDPGIEPNAVSFELPAGQLIKAIVKETGMQKIKAQNLISAGFPPGTSTADIKLFKRTYDDASMLPGSVDVSFGIVEAAGGISGEFDGSDYLVFYGQRLRDDSLQDDPIEKFSDHNVYWIGVGPGVLMTRAAVRRGYVSADTSLAVFQIDELYEEDGFFLEQTPRPAVSDPPLQQDSFYYNDPLQFLDPQNRFIEIPFSAHGIKPGSSLNIEAEFAGGNLANTKLREVLLSIENQGGSFPINSAFVSGNNRVTYYSQPIPSSDLRSSNRLRLAPEAGKSAISASLNRFTVKYNSLYQAETGRIQFDTSSFLGDTTISITHLSRRDLLLFDVTDPLHPKECIIADSLFTDTGMDQVLSFRDQVSTKKKYILTPLDGIAELGGSDLIGDSPSGLIGSPSENGVDILVISHKDFLSEMQRWVDYRRAQGYRVLAVDVEDVFDEFGGGVPSASAVKSFIRHFFIKGGAAFVLLVGDSSEDAKRVHADSGINFVPTQSYPERIQSPPFNEDEVVTSDKWYALMDNDYRIGDSDYLADLIVGRLPAGSVSELKIMLDKIFLFENPTASDFWRRRMIQMADDSWSDDGFSSTTCFRLSELGFEQGEESAAFIMGSSLAGGYDIDRQYLSLHTSVIHPVNSGCVDKDQVKSYTRSHALPALLNAVELGATFLSIQAHMNRYLITHETLFSSSDVIGRDHYKLQNFGKPFIVFAMGCHLSDYAVHRELARTLNNDINGDCIDELFLFLKNRGAVSSYGSSGFEYLGENMVYTNRIYDTFFNNPPVDTMTASTRAQARWIFGEVMTVSEMLGATYGQIKRYHILGDPLLRIDAGPPRFEVKVNGSPANSGDLIVGASNDSVTVEAVVSDENAIDSLALEIAGFDESSILDIQPLIDGGLSASRQYSVRFSHKLLPKSYDIKLMAYQAPDTVSGSYHMAAEFILSVPLDISLKVNGRSIGDGDLVPAKAGYALSLRLPVIVDAREIVINMDDAPVSPVSFSRPAGGDTLSWIAEFSQSLSEGTHTLSVVVSSVERQHYLLRVSARPGLEQLIAYPNPFTDEAYFVFTNEIPIHSGRVDIYTSGGKKIAAIDFPSSSRMPGQNAVYWNGRDRAGDAVANGVYLYVVTIVQNGSNRRFTGKIVHIK